MSNYGLEKAATAPYLDSPQACRMPTLKERLSHAVKEAEERLAEAREAKDIFDRNPDMERLLDIMQRGRF